VSPEYVNLEASLLQFAAGLLAILAVMLQLGKRSASPRQQPSLKSL